MMAPESERAMWLVWSAEHQLWWRPNSCGYTDSVTEAGRYTFAKALSICDTRNSGDAYPKGTRRGTPDEVLVPAPEYFDRIRELDAPNEPTLTCSEVVERLAECVINPARGYNFDRGLAEKILDSWRERRVQELEERLAKRSLTPELSSTQPDTGSEKK